MKTFLLIATLITSLSASAVTLHQKKVTLPVDISTTRLLMSNAGYGENYILKVIIPELADITFLNHRNPSAGGPCMATYETMDVDAVLQGNPAVEKIDFDVTLNKDVYFDGNVCQVSLTETVVGKIRGFTFRHSVSQALPTRTEEDCR
jgi:hypothetical protein